MLYDSVPLKGDAIMRRSSVFAFLSLSLLLISVHYAISAVAQNPGSDAVLKASEVSAKIFPEKVFFRGQLAPVQMRNTGGVHFADDLYFLAGLVDNSGYSSGLRQKFQGYLITEVPLEIAGQTLKPGAYGFGFLDGGKFVVLDLGANDVLQVASQHDAEIKRPTPLQVLATAGAGSYRLYGGRDFVEFRRLH
jgi:hypothetical protein